VVCATYKYTPELADVLLCAVSCLYKVSVVQHRVGGALMSNRLSLCGRQRSWPVSVCYPVTSLSLENLWNSSVRKAGLQIRSNLWGTGYEAGAFQLRWTLPARIYCCPSRGTEAASCKLIIGMVKSGLNLAIVVYLVTRLRMLGVPLRIYVAVFI
jgi:hypothetical protein